MAGHDPQAHGRAVAVYGLASLLVLAVGSVAIWSFVERRTIRGTLAPEALPAVAVVTADPDSELAAAWVELLTKAQFSPTLVPIERYEPSEGVLALADVDELTPRLAEGIRATLAQGGGVAVLGRVPEGAAALLAMTAGEGTSGSGIVFSEAASPVLARVRPGHSLRTAPRPVSLLEESPAMKVDARWEESARAAIAHYRHGGGRVLFLGFSPAALWNRADNELGLMLRTAFRWVAGQPVSEAAAGMPAASRTLTSASRLQARGVMSWSVDRLEADGDSFVLRIRNNGSANLPNPTVKIWLPESAAQVDVAGSLFGRRGVSLSAVEGERAAIVSLAGLRAHEERLIRLGAGE
jgi:hypothetical protein